MVISQQLSRKITIEQPTESKDSNGMVTQAWTTYYQPMAKISPALGREYYEAKQLTSDQSIKFNIRYSNKAAGITPKMRISYNSSYYDIGSVINSYENNREIVIMAVLKNA